jgi:hypothetical protein
VLLLGAVAGCGGGALSLGDLAEHPSSCPVDLAAAARTAGVETSGAVTGKSVRGPVPAGRHDDGVVAECHVGVAGGGDLSLLLVAAKDGSAMAALLPDVVDRAGLPASDYGPILTAAGRTSAGDLVRVPGTEPVAVLVVPIRGSGNAAARLFAQGGPDRTRVEAVARALGAELS